MSDTPWYERNSTIFLAGAAFGLVLFLAQPFMDKQWPDRVAAFMQQRWGRLVVGSLSGAAGMMVGYVLGRRRRPYSGPLMVVDGAAEAAFAPPVKGPQQLTIVEASSGVKVDERDLIAAVTWVVTPKNRPYIPVRADLRLGQKEYRAERMVILPGGQHPRGTAIAADDHGHVEVQFHVPDDIAPVGTRLSGDVTLTDSSNDTITRAVVFGPVPRRPPLIAWNWP